MLDVCATVNSRVSARVVGEPGKPSTRIGRAFAVEVVGEPENLRTSQARRRHYHF